MSKCVSVDFSHLCPLMLLRAFISPKALFSNCVHLSIKSPLYLAVSSLSPSTPRMSPPACSQSARVSPMQRGMSTNTTWLSNSYLDLVG